MVNYTAKYIKISSGYMGQLVEWPEVVTEGKDLEECRAMLRDALYEMVAAYKQLGNEILVAAYKQLGNEIPLGNALIEQLPIEVESVSQAS
ncbi:MAG: type II toxin-antitoxin system HicB family antitoxin [Deltaproteobacteria bacterium]|nr:type II toxin-antitoxin system HicB family antitoxin [Deltaproteobacteria bacterium]